MLECKEDSINGRPDNCRNPALWEKRCKAISKLCEKNLPFALENAAVRRAKMVSMIIIPGSARRLSSAWSPPEKKDETHRLFLSA